MGRICTGGKDCTIGRAVYLIVLIVLVPRPTAFDFRPYPIRRDVAPDVFTSINRKISSIKINTVLILVQTIGDGKRKLNMIFLIRVATCVVKNRKIKDATRFIRDVNLDLGDEPAVRADLIKDICVICR